MNLFNVFLADSNGQIVYNENLPFRTDENLDQEIKDFIRWIRPTLKFEIINYCFLRKLKSNEL